MKERTNERTKEQAKERMREREKEQTKERAGERAKKQISLLLAAIVLAAIFASCGAQGGGGGATQAASATTAPSAAAAASEETEAASQDGAAAAEAATEAAAATTAPVESATAAAPAEAPVTVVLAVAGDDQPDQALVEAEWNKYLEEKLNARLHVMNISWGEYTDKTVQMMTAHEDIDLIFTMSGVYYNDIAKNAYAPLNALLDEYGRELKAAINPLYLTGPLVNGELYMIPTNKELAEGRSLFLDTSLIDKYGLDVRTEMTIEELMPLFEVIKANEPDVSIIAHEDFNWYPVTKGYLENIDKTWSIVPGLEQYVVNLETGEARHKLELDFCNERYGIYRECREKGYYSVEVDEGRATAAELIAQGRLFCYKGMVKPYEPENYKAAYSLEKEPTTIFAGKPLIKTESTTGAGLSITSYSAKKEAAMQVMNLLWTDEQLINLVQSGIEGRHYVKSDAARFWKSLPEGAENAGETGYAAGYSWQFGNDMLNLIWDTVPADFHDQYQIFNDTSMVSPVLGFFFSSDDVKNEVSATDALGVQYVQILEDGKAADVEGTIATAVDEIRKAGSEKVCEAIKAQYLAWRAAQQ
jgi:putative aldouronate transport system substrate-binding protein